MKASASPSAAGRLLSMAVLAATLLIRLGADATAFAAAAPEVFAVRAGSYPVRRWAEQTAARYRRMGIYAFVAPSPDSDGSRRHRVYLGKFHREEEADATARDLARAQVIPRPFRVEAVALNPRRTGPTPLNDKEAPPEASKTGRHNRRPQPRPTPGERDSDTGPKTPDHYGLIRSLLGGVADAEDDRVIERHTPPVRKPPPLPAAAPTGSSPRYDLVPITSP